MKGEISISSRFNGPPDSGNGGYVCGIIAAAVDQPVRVRLHKPPPLDCPLTVADESDGSWRVLDGDELIATATPAVVSVIPPAPPSYVEALGASTHYVGFHAHPYPTCFVCGPQRERGDGLRIFPASVPGMDLVAAPWLPHRSLDDGQGKVCPEYHWAALDCPGYFAVARNGEPMLLGELAVHVDRCVHIEEPCVVAGWLISSEGRKHRVGTALYDEDGEVCARGEATWIAVQATPTGA